LLKERSAEIGQCIELAIVHLTEARDGDGTATAHPALGMARRARLAVEDRAESGFRSEDFLELLLPAKKSLSCSGPNVASGSPKGASAGLTCDCAGIAPNRIAQNTLAPKRMLFILFCICSSPENRCIVG
jgi:hypothetical protein